VIKIPIIPYWENVKDAFMSSRDQWIMESENLSNEMSVWLAQEHGCTIRGRKHLYFHFATEYDAEMFVLRFSGKN